MAIKRMKNGFKLTGNDAREYVRQLGVKIEEAAACACGEDLQLSHGHFPRGEHKPWCPKHSPTDSKP